jgi:hypothetical protein
LTYTVEASRELTGAWSPVVVNGNPGADTNNVAGSVTTTDPVSISSGKRFTRFNVTC